MKAMFALPLVALALSACDRSDPPAAKMERAAEELVEEVEGEDLPQQAEGPYAPRDECTDQPGAAAFLQQLRRAVEARDAEAVAALAAEDVRLAAGEDGDRAQMVAALESREGDRWSALEDAMAMGCASDGATMTMPWYFAQEIVGDGVDRYIVTGEDIPIRAEAAPDSDLVARLSWVAVTVPEDGPRQPDRTFITWNDTDTGREESGYIARHDLRPVSDYRLQASRRNDRWRITQFVAGD